MAEPSELDGSFLLLPGHRIGKYQIVRVLGQGGMGAIYEATHTDLKKRVALKTLLPKHAQNREARARFLREGEAASRIRHPNVVDVTDVGADGGVPYLVMEFLVGENLSERIARAGALPIAHAVDVVLPVASAVAEGHRRGVVHRDLKPHNIFITNDRMGNPVPKVLDFGISKLRDGDQPKALTETSSFLGTVSYVSPEQARGARTVDGRSDEYSLAVVLYQALTGKTPHEGESAIELLYKIGSGELVPPRTLRPELPPELEGILLRAMHTDPEQRFETVRAFGAALLPFASEPVRSYWSRDFLGPPRPLTPAPPPPGQDALAHLSSTREDPKATTLGSSALELHEAPRRRWPRKPVIAAFALLGTVALLAIWLAGGDDSRPVPVAAHTSTRPLAAPPPPVVPAKVARPFAIETTPRVAVIELDGKRVGRGAFAGELPDDGRAHSLRVHAPGFAPAEVTFSYDEPPPPQIALERLARRAPVRARRTNKTATAKADDRRPQIKRGTNNALILE